VASAEDAFEPSGLAGLRGWRMIEKEPGPVPFKGWAEMIRKVYEMDPLT